MTSGGLTMEEALRLQSIQPGAPGPVKDPATLRMLLDVAAVLLCDLPGDVFTFEKIITEVRGCLGDGQTVDDADLQAALDASTTIEKVDGGYRWR